MLARRNSWRASVVGLSKAAGTQTARGETSAWPEALSRNGRTNKTKVTQAETGLPGMPRKAARPTRPNANGLPGLMAIFQRSSVPSAVTADLM